MSSKLCAKEAVLNYLQIQHRPYSANDITANLHKEYTKSAVQKALDELSDSKLIREKSYGKQKIYSIVEEEFCESHGVPTVNLNSELETARENVLTLKQEVKARELLMKELASSLRTDDYVRLCSDLEHDIANVATRVQLLSQCRVVPQQDKQQVAQRYDEVVKALCARKRTCMDIVDSVLENYPLPFDKLFEEIGMELV